MKHISLIVVFLILCHSGFSQTIKGFVRDDLNRGIAGANISAEGTSKGTTSSADGSYKLHLKPGQYSISASYVGFLTQTHQVSLTENHSIALDFILIESLVNMPEIVISAASDESSDLIQIPLRTATLSYKDITETPAVSTTALLSGISGVHVHSESGIFSSSSVSLRGIGGSSQTGTLVVMDGIPLNKTDGGSVNWNIIDKDNIETIQVIKGPGSALFGSNAMGGIINIISKKPSETIEGNCSFSYGTYNTAEGKAFLGGRKNIFYWKTFIHYRSSDGYISTPDQVIAENDTIVVPVFLKELYAGGLIGFQLTELSNIELSVNYFNDIRGRGTKVFEELGSNTERRSYQSFIKYTGSFKSWKTYSNVYMLKENYLRLNEYYSDGEYKLYEVDSKRDDFGYRLYTEKKFKDNKLTLGSDGRFGSVDAKDTYYTSTDLISNQGKLDVVALFAQYASTFGRNKWTIVGGLRFDAAFFHDAAFTIDKPSYSIEYFTDFQFQDVESKTWNSISPKLSMQYQPNKKIQFYVTAAKGFRAPMLDDLCRSERSSRGLRVANPELGAEYILNTETGFDYDILKSLKLQVSVYNIAGFDFMHDLSTGDSVNLGYTLAPIFEVSNISRVSIKGAEVDLKWNPFKILKLAASYTLTHATIGSYTPKTGADIDLTGKFLTNIPLHRGSAGIYFTPKIANISFTANYTGKRWIRDDNRFDNIYLMSDSYEPYLTINAKIHRTFGNFEAEINVDNIMNKIYINSKGYKSPGRMIFLKIKYSIKQRKNENKNFD